MRNGFARTATALVILSLAFLVGCGSSPTSITALDPVTETSVQLAVNATQPQAINFPFTLSDSLAKGNTLLLRIDQSQPAVIDLSITGASLTVEVGEDRNRNGHIDQRELDINATTDGTLTNNTRRWDLVQRPDPALEIAGIAQGTYLVKLTANQSTTLDFVGTATAVDALPEGVIPEVNGHTSGEEDAPIFIQSCQPSHFNNDDPLVFPNQVGRSHLHLFFGNPNTDAFSTAASLKSSGISTCPGLIQNRSAYWVPSMLTASGEIVQPENNVIYYSRGGVPETEIQTIPEGLTMIAGDAKAITAQNLRVVRWRCDSASVRSFQNTIPNCRRGDQVKMVISFPQCWDGVNLSSPDQSHMAYAANQTCPSTHPVAIPEIVFHVNWLVTERTGTNGWRLASDTAVPGYTAHGDYIMAWNPETLDTLVSHCINGRLFCLAGLGNGTRLVPSTSNGD